MTTQTDITEATVTVPKLLTQRQASEITGQSEKWFERDRWIGPTVPYCKLGRAVRYRAADIAAYIERNMQGVA